MKTEIAKLKAAIITAGIVELVAQSAALWFKAARVALFFKATNQRTETIVSNDKGEPTGLTETAFNQVAEVNRDQTLRDAEKRLRAIAGKCQADADSKSASGKATVNRKGGAGITGIRVNELPDIATNKALKAIATLKAELFADCVTSYVTGKEPLDNLYTEFLSNGKAVIALNSERVAIAHKVIVELEKDDNHKSLSSFAWYPAKGTQAEKDAAIAKTIRSHHKRIEREKAVSNEQFQAALKEAEKAEKAAEKQPDTVTVEKAVKIDGKTATVKVHKKAARRPRQKQVAMAS
jgi:hypothetical protein